MERELEDDLRALADRHRPDPEELAAMRRRLARDLDAPRRRRWPVTLAVAAAVAGVLIAGGRALGPADRGIDLSGEGRTLNQGVVANVAGQGRAEVDGDHTRVAWASGRLSLEVEPADGRQVEIHTEEAIVRVIGTALVVDRSPFGTSVAVDHGLVRFECHTAGTIHDVGAGQRRDCLKDAGAGLGQLLALERRGASAEVRLQVVQAAMAHPVGLPATRAALLDRRLELLVALGRVDDAIAVAAGLPAPDRIAWWRAGANQAMADAGCPSAMPWLDALSEGGDPVGTLLWVQCVADEAPQRALAALDALDAEALDPEEAEMVARWREALR